MLARSEPVSLNLQELLYKWNSLLILSKTSILSRNPQIATQDGQTDRQRLKDKTDYLAGDRNKMVPNILLDLEKLSHISLCTKC